MNEDHRDRILFYSDVLCERRGTSTQEREERYMYFARALTAHYSAEFLHGHVLPLLDAAGKSVKAESSERETLMALKVISLIAVTTADESIYENIAPVLRRAIENSQSRPTKSAAIYTLGTCTFFGGAGDEGILDEMNFLLEIISSDGVSVDAADDENVVTAACEEFGFLATELDDLEGESEDFIEALIDQFDASDAGVQIAAGENIALLYEKSYTPQEDDESDLEDANQQEIGDSSSDDDLSGPKLVKRYDPYHNKHDVLAKATALASLSGHKVNRKSKRDIHKSFNAIAATIENPRLGPHYNKATGGHYGRSKVRIHTEGEMHVDRWWKLLRLKALRRVLQGGFVNHYFEGNRAVLDTLPMVITQKKDSSPGRKGRKPMRGEEKRLKAGTKGFGDHLDVSDY